ncbi:IS630 family transposase [Flammeovirgaceae bacterium SG7u.111]|nr:IS630 family transposase [Flammeovirgaceae bacterium SG7u.132]WPO38220.1 IS630 family transposase [Flammeovirgaceae bacterium SG7u.111]WPO38549.1 IS630 family transposase [Flammeovirgaceae bacterium SG7u.111]
MPPRVGGRVSIRWKSKKNSIPCPGRACHLSPFFCPRGLHQVRQGRLWEDRQAEIDLCYFDETGISLCPNVPYAWQPVGTANKLPARRGNGVSVLGILDPLANTFTGSYYHGAANSACVIQVLDSFSETITKKTVLVLDNAAIHRSKEVGEAMGKWKKKGLYLQFIPAYCPELNLIEILWKMLKHYWIRPRHYASMQSLIEATLYILQNYGKQYSISFG